MHINRFFINIYTLLLFSIICTSSLVNRSSNSNAFINLYSNTLFNKFLSHGKQVITLGPTSNNYDVIKSFLEAGANVFRLNFSHGNRLSKIRLVQVIRDVERDTGRLVAILGDIQGPKIRIGKIAPNVNAPGFSPNSSSSEFVHLDKGQTFTFDSFNLAGDKNRVQLPYKEILQLLQPGHSITVDDGNLHFLVKNTAVKGYDYIVETEVLNSGKISSRKGFNCPDVIAPIDIFSEKDIKDIAVCLAMDLNLLAVSFVQSHHDMIYTKNIISHFERFEKRDALVEKVRSLAKKYVTMEESKLLSDSDLQLEQLLDDFYESIQSIDRNSVSYNAKIGLIPKIEMQAAVNDFHNIVRESDGVMIARGDLGVNMDLTKLPIVQKRLAYITRYIYKKPCIVATQMLESMVKNPVPTRAEVTDVANALYDGADAVMLSAESANGKYPLECVLFQRRVIDKVSDDPLYYHTLAESSASNHALLTQSLDNCRITPRQFENLKKQFADDKPHFMNELNANNTLNQIVNKISEITSSHTVDMIAVFANNVNPINWIAASRIGVPIFAFVPEDVSRLLQLTWSVNPTIFNIDEFNKAKETSLQYKSSIDGLDAGNDVHHRAMDYLAVEKAKTVNMDNVLVVSSPNTQANPMDSFYMKLISNIN